MCVYFTENALDELSVGEVTSGEERGRRKRERKRESQNTSEKFPIRLRLAM